MLGKYLELLVEHHGTACRIVLDHERTRVIEQDFLGRPAKLRERTFQPNEPALLPFVAECPDVTAARVAKRGNKQVGAQLAPPISTRRSPKSICSCLPKRGLKPRVVARACAANSRRYGTSRTLDRAKTDDDVLLGKEFLANDVGIPAMSLKSLPQAKLLFLSGDMKN
jgi:hypothetical protein